MKWQKENNRKQVAVGNHGTFIAEKRGTQWWARYVSSTRSFTLPPQGSLPALKDMVFDNNYWEWEEVKR